MPQPNQHAERFETIAALRDQIDNLARTGGLTLGVAEDAMRALERGMDDAAEDWAEETGGLSEELIEQWS